MIYIHSSNNTCSDHNICVGPLLRRGAPLQRRTPWFTARARNTRSWVRAQAKKIPKIGAAHLRARRRIANRRAENPGYPSRPVCASCARLQAPTVHPLASYSGREPAGGRVPRVAAAAGRAPPKCAPVGAPPGPRAGRTRPPPQLMKLRSAQREADSGRPRWMPHWAGRAGRAGPGRAGPRPTGAIALAVAQSGNRTAKFVGQPEADSAGSDSAHPRAHSSADSSEGIPATRRPPHATARCSADKNGASCRSEPLPPPLIPVVYNGYLPSTWLYYTDTSPR